MPICKLCEQEKKLINAHIIPKAFFSLPLLNAEPAKILSSIKGVYPKTTRTGIYDSGILCGSCDGKLGILDQYVAERLIQKKEFNQLTFVQAVGRRYANVNPDLVQKFLLSVLWRASVSNHYFFSRVSLGPYENTIASILREEKEDPYVIPAILGEFSSENPPVLDPHSTCFEGVRFWVIYANRFIFYIQTDKRRTPSQFRPFCVKPKAPLISIVRSWDKSKELAVLTGVARANPGAFRPRTP